MIEQLGNLAQGSPMVPVSRGIFHMLDGFEEPVGFDFDHEIGDRFEDLSALANISVADGPLESFAGDDFHDPCFLTKFTQGGLLRCLPDLDPAFRELPAGARVAHGCGVKDKIVELAGRLNSIWNHASRKFENGDHALRRVIMRTHRTGRSGIGAWLIKTPAWSRVHPY